MNSPDAAAGEKSLLVEARDVYKSYPLAGREVKVLMGVSLAIYRGDFLALRGASGAGKSTLLHLLGGLDLPNSGTVLFGNQDLKQFSTTELARWRNRRVGLIFQAYHLLPELTALENVCLPGRVARFSAAVIERKATELLGLVGLKERTQHRPYELSGGEQQRVAIARALINQPDLIIADEPTGNLDSKTGGEIFDLLMQIQREHRTTLVVATHDWQLANRAARVVELVDGKLAVK